MKLGAQLFTVREFTRNLDDFAETLKKIADIGYDTVQVSGTCPFEAEWLKEQLDKNGLVCAITHTNADRIAYDTEKVIAEHKIFGCNYIGLGGVPKDYRSSPAGLDGFVETFAPAAKKISDAGLKFMYHNHGFEFQKVNGVTLLERIAKAFPKDQMGFTLDSYWVQYGGGDPAAWIEKLEGRVECIHLKDMKFVEDKQQMAYIGEGNINFDRYLAACEKSGTKYALVEQDDCQGRDPFFCLKKSYEYLTSLGLK
jgi:sugar phosphate isomerase/epimerase